MPNYIKNNFFKAFATIKCGGGTGLGTADAKTMVELHNGKISMETSKEEGTDIYITLPKTAKNA